MVTTEANPEGTGTLANPFDSLSAALLCRVFASTTIQLLPGVHWLKLVAASSTLQTWTQFSDLQSYVSSTSSLTITSADCAETCQRVVLMYDNLNPLQLSIHGRVTIANVTILGNSTLVQGCTGPQCLYCPTLTVNATTSQATDDQGNVYSAGLYAPSALCQRFKYYSFITITSNATLRISNVTIAGFLQGLGSLISLKAARVTLTDVLFVNISTKSGQSSQPNQPSQNQAITNAVIQQNSSNPTSGNNVNGTTYEAGSILLQ
jgi:hypothetical protein